MDNVKELIRNKPRIFILISVIYLVALALGKWRIHPSGDTAWFLAGGVIGIYFLDGAELFFHLTPSPFRSVVFMALFTIVGLFVVTSSGSTLASGLVLSLYLQMILWQVGELRVTGNLTSWYRMMAVPVALKTQQIILFLFSVLFLLETYFFIQ
jgi:hypothetical protein